MSPEVYVSPHSPIILGGCGRSGTTLLRVMLDSHRHLCCGPESYLLTPRLRQLDASNLAWKFDLPKEQVLELTTHSRSPAEFADRFFQSYAAARGKPRWADKTPRNVTALPYIFRHFPRARFVHLIRDGRDVACSLRTHPRHRVVNGQLVPLRTRNPWSAGVQRWVRDTQAGLAFRGDHRYVEVRYEDLVAEPEATLRRLLAFLGEEWDEQVLRFHEVGGGSRDVRKFPQNPEATRPLYDSAAGKWRREMTLAEAVVFKESAGALLIQLGYASDDRWQAEST